VGLAVLELQTIYQTASGFQIVDPLIFVLCMDGTQLLLVLAAAVQAVFMVLAAVVVVEETLEMLAVLVVQAVLEIVEQPQHHLQ
jgi:hypothetical protein